jgi:hypothetical protein
MGGYGSGRTSGSRDLTTSYRALDIIAEANRSISLTSDGTTRISSRQEIGTMMLHSRTPRREDLHASVLRSDDELIAAPSVKPILSMLQQPAPTSQEEKLRWMEG